METPEKRGTPVQGKDWLGRLIEKRAAEIEVEFKGDEKELKEYLSKPLPGDEWMAQKLKPGHKWIWKDEKMQQVLIEVIK